MCERTSLSKTSAGVLRFGVERSCQQDLTATVAVRYMQWLLTGGIDALVDARDANITYLMRFQTRLTAEISGSEGSGGTASSNRSPSSLN